MKKFITMAVVLTMLAAFTGCSNNNNSVSDSSSASSDVVSSTESESTPAEDSSADSDISDITEDSSDVSEDESSDTSDDTSDDNNGETTEGKAAKYAEAALTAGTWPGLESLTDAALVESLTGINTADAEDFYVGLPATSANCEEIIVIKPVAGSEDTVKAALDNHMAIVTDPMNVYPSQEETIAGAVSGTTADGYYYLIVNKSGSDCADALNALEA